MVQAMKWLHSQSRSTDYLEESCANGHLIALRGLEKTFESAAGTQAALRQVDLQIDAGEFVTVSGKSGSGKSTLLNMMAGIDRPSAGEVIVNGASIRQMSEGQIAEWRGRTMGIVFQFFQLIPTLNVIDNVMLPMDFCNMYSPAEREKRAGTLLGLVGITEHAYKPPSALSGGEQQRVAIARALANDPPLILADEPTGNLDSKTAAAIFGLFESLVTQGKTVVMVTHDPDLARAVPRQIEIADGRIVRDYRADRSNGKN
jgi:putative ABC transport system ATP-binding protein